MYDPLTEDELEPFRFKRSAPDDIDMPVPVSREVIGHVVRLHEERCGRHFITFKCFCSTAFVLICTRCDRPVYVVVSLKSTCEMALRLWSEGVPLQRWSS